VLDRGVGTGLGVRLAERREGGDQGVPLGSELPQLGLEEIGVRPCGDGLRLFMSEYLGHARGYKGLRATERGYGAGYQDGPIGHSAHGTATVDA